MPEHKILIVEDEEAIAHVMESILSANHYIPLSAKNGGQALALEMCIRDSCWAAWKTARLLPSRSRLKWKSKAACGRF